MREMAGIVWYNSHQRRHPNSDPFAFQNFGGTTAHEASYVQVMGRVSQGPSLMYALVMRFECTVFFELIGLEWENFPGSNKMRAFQAPLSQKSGLVQWCNNTQASGEYLIESDYSAEIWRNKMMSAKSLIWKMNAVYFRMFLNTSILFFVTLLKINHLPMNRTNINLLIQNQ